MYSSVAVLNIAELRRQADKELVAYVKSQIDNWRRIPELAEKAANGRYGWDRSLAYCGHYRKWVVRWSLAGGTGAAIMIDCDTGEFDWGDPLKAAAEVEPEEVDTNLIIRTLLNEIGEVKSSPVTFPDSTVSLPEKRMSL